MGKDKPRRDYKSVTQKRKDINHGLPDITKVTPKIDNRGLTYINETIFMTEDHPDDRVKSVKNEPDANKQRCEEMRQTSAKATQKG